MEADGWEPDAARGGDSRAREGTRGSFSAWESWKGEELKAAEDGLGVVSGVEVKVVLRAVEELGALDDGDFGVGGTVDQESFDGALGFLVSM